jgi:hypothetical protein
MTNHEPAPPLLTTKYIKYKLYKAQYFAIFQKVEI